MNQECKPHCVVADDVRPYRELVRSWLVEWGFHCTSVARAKDAWDEIQSKETALVVTDIDMPEISGLQLIRAIRASDCLHNRAIPVIAISSLQDDEIDLITQQVGAIRFIPKPLDKNRFHAAVCAVMGMTNDDDAMSTDTVNSDDHGGAPNVSPRLRRLIQDEDTAL